MQDEKSANMLLPKFIITMDGTFRMGMVDQHKDLLRWGEQCMGGGYYFIDYQAGKLILDRSSYDFGRPKWHLVEVLKVPVTYKDLQLVYIYNDGFHDDLILNDELKIEYYD